MKTFTTPLALTFAVALVGCGAGIVQSPTLESQLRNPLFAERYWQELTERMVNIQLKDKTLSQNEARRKLVDSVRLEALAKRQEQTTIRRDGLIGAFVTVEEETEGLVLLLKDKLFFSPEFVTYPGPSLHVYLTEAIDPREVDFPDASSVDLGLLELPYGAQQYMLPPEADAKTFHTVVLWDTKLERIYGFAQLSK